MKNLNVTQIASVSLGMAIVPVLMFVFSEMLNQNMVSDIKDGRDVHLTEIQRGSSYSSVSIYGTLGDVFSPNKDGIFRNVDAIMISALIEPIYGEGKYTVMESNSLLRSFLRHVGTDSHAAPMADEVLSRLNRLSSESGVAGVCRGDVHLSPEERAKIGGEFINNRCDPFVIQTQPKSSLKREGIDYISVLPLFFSKNEPRLVSGRALLARNVEQNVSKALIDLSERLS